MSEARLAPEFTADILLRRLLAEAAVQPEQLRRARTLAGTGAQAQLRALWQDPSLDEAAVALAFARETGWPLLDLDAYRLDEALLRDMVLEANGGAGVGRGVTRAEFDEVMRRAGAWK